jgi:hypothetical protein
MPLYYSLDPLTWSMMETMLRYQVSKIVSSERLPSPFMAAPGILMSYLLDHENQTQNAVVFQTYQGQVLGYTVLYNSSRTSERLIPSIIRALDQAMHSLDPDTFTDMESEISSMGYPKSKPRFLSSSSK